MKSKRPFEAQLTRLSLMSSVPTLLFLLWVMTYADISIWLILLTGLVGGIFVVFTNCRIHEKLVYQFRSLNNLLDALTRGDYSLRARSDQSYGELGELVTVINGLAERLSEQRRESVESQLLVSTIIEHIDVAIVALNEQDQVSFLNPAAKRLLLLDKKELNGALIEKLMHAQPLSQGHHHVVELTLGYQQGRFNVHVEEFRESGLQHKLLFITDVRTLLRDEERKAWQSLVRVISHEINNSLSPIASISQTLTKMISQHEEKLDISADLSEGLTIIAERANALRTFVESYKQLAKLPEPQKKKTSLLRMLEKIAVLFSGNNIVIETNVDIELYIDPIQFEQVLINLIKNAIEAMSKIRPEGRITIKWNATESLFTITLCDEGSGVSNLDNVFVPFYSTKKHGSGIGLVLSRQIIEAHHGHLYLANREDEKGCCATIELPRETAQPLSSYEV